MNYVFTVTLTQALGLYQPPLSTRYGDNVDYESILSYIGLYHVMRDNMADFVQCRNELPFAPDERAKFALLDRMQNIVDCHGRCLTRQRALEKALPRTQPGEPAPPNVVLNDYPVNSSVPCMFREEEDEYLRLCTTLVRAPHANSAGSLSRNDFS
jgi:hypothetical protein